MLKATSDGKKLRRVYDVLSHHFRLWYVRADLTSHTKHTEKISPCQIIDRSAATKTCFPHSLIKKSLPDIAMAAPPMVA
ncbi:CLUMA_CG008311, isoform A [Clunio marinus]|uniref:CLUMA_CG008311, isoform A n=1 Tax=Clunio marinus TaxID=568069 RepID=A0A1J1I8S0_9DIPT|nr:CLUMA_CG008311, isoform A [Clunio marinus]